MRTAGRTTASIRIALSISAMALGLLSSYEASQAQAAPAGPHVDTILVTSPSMSEGGQIALGVTCLAGPSAKSPGVQWTGVPTKAASLVLYFHDLEPHPNGGAEDNLHWVMWNIPPSSKGLPAEIAHDPAAVPEAVQGRNTHGDVGYGPPCPPPGQPNHHYVLEVFALDITLHISQEADRHELMAAIDKHIIGHGVLVALFRRD